MSSSVRRHGARVTFAWASLFACLGFGCERKTDTVFYPLYVGFETSTSESSEGASDFLVALTMNAPSDAEVVVHIALDGGTASMHDDCGSRDYSAPETTVVFAPGQTTQTVSLRQLNDESAEADETIFLRIESVTGASIGKRASHTHTILDDDRGVLLDVAADFGAVGDGATDDTDAIQRAIDRARLSENAVVFFPPGRYLVTQLTLSEGVSYVGYEATILQAEGRPRDAQLLTVSHRGASDSRATLVQGLTIDGQRDLQGAFADRQREASTLLSAFAHPGEAGRLRLVMEDVTMQFAGGNGLVLGTNTDAVVCRMSGEDVFTDLVKLSGGNSSLTVRQLEADGTVGTTGIALTGLIPGFLGSQAVDVTLSGLLLRTGDLEIDVQEGAFVYGEDIVMSTPPLYLRAVRSEIHLVDSDLRIGPPRLRENRIVAPSNVLLENCDLTLSEIIEPNSEPIEADRELVLAHVTWDDVAYASLEGETDQMVEVMFDQRLTFRECRFHLADDIDEEDVTFVGGTQGAAADESQLLLIEGGTIDERFSAVFAPGCAVCQQTPP